MKRQVLFWTLSLVLCIITGGVIAWNTYVPNSEFRVTQEEVQTYLDANLPQKGAWVEITDARLEFKKNTLHTAVSLRTNEFAGHTYTMNVLTEGTPRYVANEGSFYFDPKTVVVETKLLTPEEKKSEEKLCAVPASFSRTRSIEDLQTNALRRVDEFMRGLLRGMVINTLQKTPVYELPKDAEGVAAAMFLEDISVVDGEVVFGLTFWRVACLVLLTLFGFLASIAVLVATVRNPVPIFALALLCIFGT
jgi:hypothetical protein